MITKGPLSGKAPKILYLTPKDLNIIYDNLCKEKESLISITDYMILAVGLYLLPLFIKWNPK